MSTSGRPDEGYCLTGEVSSPEGLIAVRLDEWQKYIGSQFLDEEQETVPAPKPKGQTAAPLLTFLPSEESEEKREAQSTPPVSATESQTSANENAVTVSQSGVSAIASQPLVPQENQSPDTSSNSIPHPAIDEPQTRLMETTAQGARPETTPNSIQNIVTMVVAPQSPPDAIPTTPRAPRIELLTPLPDQTPAQYEKDVQPEVSNRSRRRSQSANSEVVSESINSPDTNMSANQLSASNSIRERNLFQPLEDMDADIPSFASYMPAPQTAPIVPAEAVEPSPIDTSFTEENQHAQHSETAEETQQLSPIERRLTRSRARHARNVRPENVPSGLSATELWAAVPRHVQTLLSLERLEAEQEVAQFSYKRPFQEKRHELIERLLDPILSLEDTARLLNVCPTTVRRYTNKGILTYYRKEPDRASKVATENGSSGEKETRQRRFRLSDILAFLETQQTALAADRQAEGRAALLDADFAEDNGKEP